MLLFCDITFIITCDISSHLSLPLSYSSSIFPSLLSAFHHSPSFSVSPPASHSGPLLLLLPHFLPPSLPTHPSLSLCCSLYFPSSPSLSFSLSLPFSVWPVWLINTSCSSCLSLRWGAFTVTPLQTDVLQQLPGSPSCGWLWCRSGTLLVQIWLSIGADLAKFWCRIGTLLRWIWSRFGSDLGWL